MPPPYKIEPATEPLAAAFIKNDPSYWTTDQAKADTTQYRDYARFLKYKPSADEQYPTMRLIKLLDGNVEYEKDTQSGKEIRDAIVMFRVMRLSIEGHEGKQIIDGDTWRAYNQVVYRNPDGVKMATAADKEHATTMIAEMVYTLKGLKKYEELNTPNAGVSLEFDDQKINQVVAAFQAKSIKDTLALTTETQKPSPQDLAAIVGGSMKFETGEASLTNISQNFGEGKKLDLTLPNNLNLQVSHTSEISAAQGGKLKKTAVGISNG